MQECAYAHSRMSLSNCHTHLRELNGGWVDQTGVQRVHIKLSADLAGDKIYFPVAQGIWLFQIEGNFLSSSNYFMRFL